MGPASRTSASVSVPLVSESVFRPAYGSQPSVPYRKYQRDMLLTVYPCTDIQMQLLPFLQGMCSRTRMQARHCHLIPQAGRPLLQLLPSHQSGVCHPASRFLYNTVSVKFLGFKASAVWLLDSLLMNSVEIPGIMTVCASSLRSA